MAARGDRIPIRGSERTQTPDSRVTGPTDPGERIQVTMLLRRRSAASEFPDVDEDAKLLPIERSHLTREEFAAVHGAAPADLEKVAVFAAEHGLEVVEARQAQRSVLLSGTVAAFSAAFRVTLQRYEHARGTFRGRTGPVHVPVELAETIDGVFGLDDRPQAEPHFRKQSRSPRAGETVAMPPAYTAQEVAELYQFPSGVDGSGQCVAILEMGGGYRSSDLDEYFTSVVNLQRPEIVDVSVDGNTNRPGINGPADEEVALDIQVAAAIAPGAKLAIYFAPLTDQGFVDALNAAVHDAANKPTVISLSWGGAECFWTAQTLDAFSSICRDAATLGITICVSAGDKGATDGAPDGMPHVDFPASCPYVLGCGGTMLRSAAGRIISETVWDEGPNGSTGGGFSAHFPVPAWQQPVLAAASLAIKPGGRGVPDVAGNAAVETGYRMVLNGENITGSGTSAVAPLWAALVARLNQLAGKSIGFLNPLLYAGPVRAALTDVTVGSNGPYEARSGWDPCTGLGSPNGSKLAEALLPSGA